MRWKLCKFLHSWYHPTLHPSLHLGLTIQFCRGCSAIRRWIEQEPVNLDKGTYLMYKTGPKGHWKYEASLDERIKRGMIEGWGNTILDRETEWTRHVD